LTRTVSPPNRPSRTAPSNSASRSDSEPARAPIPDSAARPRPLVGVQLDLQQVLPSRGSNGRAQRHRRAAGERQPDQGDTPESAEFSPKLSSSPQHPPRSGPHTAHGRQYASRRSLQGSPSVSQRPQTAQQRRSLSVCPGSVWHATSRRAGWASWGVGESVNLTDPLWRLREWNDGSLVP